jgi:cytochrome c oxidase assembly protein subunit 15
MSMSRGLLRDKMAAEDGVDAAEVEHYQFGMSTVTTPWIAQWWQPGPRAVGIWLLAIAFVIVAMVTLGGLTRLTGSGLSITELHPVTGILPPLSDHAWQIEFEKYRRIPQYFRENAWMSLADFKTIYWWEWTHRLLGRVLGLMFFVPVLWFAWTGAIGRRDWPRMALLFALGGLQGFIGWWMVESGLETRVSVSQYRLAMHLGTAVLLLGAILWTALEYLRDMPRAPTSALVTRRNSASNFAMVFVVLVSVQMLLGALVAGLHAGLIYNTWPSMDGHLFPDQPFFQAPWWINVFENPGLVQFDHRIVAYIVVLGALGIWLMGRRAGLTGLARASGTAVLHLTLLQVVLGIITLLAQAPLALAALHQLTAAALFCAAVWHAFEWRALRYAAIA